MVSATSLTQHCMTLSTTEVKYVAMVKGVKERLFVRSILSFIEPGVVLSIELFEEHEGAIVVTRLP